MISLTNRERLRRLNGQLGGPVGVGLALGVLGPFGTYETLPLDERLGYWLAVVSVNWIIADALIRRVAASFGDDWPLPLVTLPFVGALLASLPATGVVTMANGLAGLGWPDNLPALTLRVSFLVILISLVVFQWRALGTRASTTSRRDQDGAVSAAALTDKPIPPAFAARLKRLQGARPLCLEMQDHYLIVHGAADSEMILCRMTDAARELDALGARVHRSWWVADEAVAGIERRGQRLFVRLVDDRCIPIGRSHRARLIKRGWLSTEAASARD